MSIKPGKLNDAIGLTNKGSYPCIWNVLTVLLTMSAATANAESSFSVICRTKRYSICTREAMTTYIHKTKIFCNSKHCIFYTEN